MCRIELDPAFHRIVKGRVAFADEKADGGGSAGSLARPAFVVSQLQARAVVLPRFTALFGGLALRAQPFGRAVAAIGAPRLEQLRHGRAVAVKPL